MLSDHSIGDAPDTELCQACAELARRLRAGEDCHAEDFFPSLPTSELPVEYALELIYTEFVIREELGQLPSPAEWFARFPQWGDRLERIIQIGGLLDDSGNSARSTVSETQSRADSDSDLKGSGPWLDHYEILERIGRGGMGVVYKARQISLNRIVALKMILAGDDAAPAERERFRREAEAVARLQHPNIVQIYTVGERGGLPFFSMEFADGGSLAQRIAGTPLPARQAAEWMASIARAMHYAHQRGIVHRDLKPGNVVLTADGVPKITDFGLAKHLNGQADQISSGAVVGTAAYMSPEQAAGKAVGPLSDLHALGAIFYEMLTGRPPFQAASRSELLERVQESEPPLPRAFNPRMDPELEAVCLKCLEKKPSARYASAEALADDLARWLRGERTRARPRRWLARLRRNIRRRPFTSVAGLLLGLAAAITPMVLYIRDPARDMERIERGLREGQAFTLISETGRPLLPFRARTNPADTPTAFAEDGTFSVESFGLGLVELLPDPPLRSYRFAAEVRHDTGYEHDAEIGIYVAHRQCGTTPGNAGHDFCALHFNDLCDLTTRYPALALKGNPVRFTLQRYTGTNKKLKIMRLQDHFRPSGRVWRKLAIEIRPEEIRAFWQDQAIGQLSHAELLKSVQLAVASRPDGMDPNLEFSSRGALGLYVHRAKASFRSVVIQPIATEN